MYHHSTYNQDQSERTDFCSGFFKHIDPKTITEVGVIFVNAQNQILLTQDNQKCSIPLIAKLESESPKQSCVRLASENNLVINTKNLKHFYYYKQCQLQEKDHIDDIFRYRYESSNVYFLAKVESEQKELENELNSIKWINPNHLREYIQGEEMSTIADLLNSELQLF